MGRIAVIGSYGVGLTMVVPRMPVAGETMLGGKFAAGPGGKGSNQAIGAARLGAQVDFLTCVGPDAFGADARALWVREGVGADQVKTGAQATMVGVILVESSGENRIIVAPGALDELLPVDVEGFASAVASADLCMISMEIPLPTVIAALRLARRVGTPTLLNPAPAAPLPVDVWPLIDYLTPNQSEARILTGAAESASPEDLIARLRTLFAGIVVLTLGAAGALAHDGAQQIRLPAVPARQVVDTTGAGDAFNAAFGVALTEGMPLQRAVHFAAAAGAYCVGTAEVVPALPYRRDLVAATELP